MFKIFKFFTNYCLFDKFFSVIFFYSIELLSLELTKELYENSVKFFEESLKAATLDETFCIKIEGFKTPGNYVAESSFCILENAVEREVDFCNNIFETFLPIDNFRGNTCQLREQQCTLLHCLFKNEILHSTWNELVCDFSNCKTVFDLCIHFY